MYKGYKIVPFIPAGRKRTMSVLFKYLELNRPLIDEVQLWLNTTNQEDIEYMRGLDSDFYKVKEIPEQFKFNPHRVQLNTGAFYQYTLDPKTIYIRLDDDIVFFDDKFLTNLLDFRINNPDYFLVFADIWNNAIISFLQQQAGHIDTSAGVVNTPFCMDEVGWGNGKFAIHIHNILLEHIKKGTVDKLFIDDYELNDFTKFSISCFAFFGKDFISFGGKLDYVDTDGIEDEEYWLCTTQPRRINRINAICGSALCSHFTFSPYQKPVILEYDEVQREQKTGMGIFERYKKIAEDKLSKDYYKNKLSPHN